MHNEQLGSLLLKKNLITDEQLAEALKVQMQRGEKIGSVIVNLGYAEKNEVGKVLAEQLGVQYIDLIKTKIDKEVLRLVPDELCKKYTVLPFGMDGKKLKVAISDPTNIFALEELRFVTGRPVSPYVELERYLKHFIVTKKSSSKIEKAINEEQFSDYKVEDDVETHLDLDSLRVAGDEAPIIKLVNFVLTEAVNKNASDIHFESYEDLFRVRIRVDGVLRELATPPLKIKNAVTSRIKILAKLDIAERRLPQDGRILLRVSNKDIDIRVSVMPAIFGEKIVLRLLEKSTEVLTLEDLGLDKCNMAKFVRAIEKPYGMILMTGPTGSGKSTTLYAAMLRLNKEGVNIMTAEDPVEYMINGVNQVHMKEDIGLSFAVALRSFLRQDPDIIMVGEMRDFETAEIAVKSALTGHLVLSTLHTNDAPSSINRLINMGIEPFLVASSVNLIAAQRLIRKVCKNCSELDKNITNEMLLNIGFEEDEIGSFIPVVGRGCDLCDFTGYKGRVAVYELMEMTEDILKLVLSGATSDDIKRQSISEGMKTLRRSGLDKVKEGVTTLDEVLRITIL